MTNLEIVAAHIANDVEDRPMNKLWVSWLLDIAIKADKKQVLLNPKWLNASHVLIGPGVPANIEPPMYWKVCKRCYKNIGGSKSKPSPSNQP